MITKKKDGQKVSHREKQLFMFIVSIIAIAPLHVFIVSYLFGYSLGNLLITVWLFFVVICTYIVTPILAFAFVLSLLSKAALSALKKEVVSTLYRIIMALSIVAIVFSTALFVLNSGPPYVYITKGVAKTVEKDVDFDAIVAWLDKTAKELSADRHWIDSDQWPSEITKLDPSGVAVTKRLDGVNHVRLEWGGPPGHYGIIVGNDIEKIPLDDFCTSEYRTKIVSNAFAWHELKRSSEEDQDR